MRFSSAGIEPPWQEREPVHPTYEAPWPNGHIHKAAASTFLYLLGRKVKNAFLWFSTIPGQTPTVFVYTIRHNDEGDEN
jgi:hypothetical protein